MPESDAPEIHESIVDQLDRIKAFLELDQDAELAHAMGIRPNLYAKWRMGQQPAFHTIRDALNRVGIRLDYLANPGNLPEDFQIDESRRRQDSDVGALRVRIRERDERIEELERVLQGFIQTWNEVQTLFPGESGPGK